MPLLPSLVLHSSPSAHAIPSSECGSLDSATLHSLRSPCARSTHAGASPLSVSILTFGGLQLCFEGTVIPTVVAFGLPYSVCGLWYSLLSYLTLLKPHSYTIAELWLYECTLYPGTCTVVFLRLICLLVSAPGLDLDQGGAGERNLPDWQVQLGARRFICAQFHHVVSE
jgi:hypothetical protein